MALFSLAMAGHGFSHGYQRIFAPFTTAFQWCARQESNL